jgi:hypothetical protein
MQGTATERSRDSYGNFGVGNRERALLQFIVESDFIYHRALFVFILRRVFICQNS